MLTDKPKKAQPWITPERRREMGRKGAEVLNNRREPKRLAIAQKTLELYLQGFGTKMIARMTGFAATSVQRALVAMPEYQPGKLHGTAVHVQRANAGRDAVYLAKDPLAIVKRESKKLRSEEYKNGAAERRERAIRRDIIRAANKEKRDQRAKFKTAYQLKKRVRTGLNTFLSGKDKQGRVHPWIGCNKRTLIIHIEKQFKKGMAWSNRDKWHIDHIIPLSMFNLSDKDQRLIASNWQNLKPEWASDNIRKSDTITNGQQHLALHIG